MQTRNLTATRVSMAFSFLAILLLSEVTLSAQYTISPVADGGGYQFDGTGVAVDAAGNVYATAVNNAPFIVKVNPSGGAPTPVAGSNYGSPYWGTNTCNTTAPTNIGFTDLGGVAVDGSGSVYVAQSGGSPIVKVSGNTFTCPFGNIDYGPLGIAVDNAGNIYFSDTYTPKFYRDEVPIGSIYGNCANGPFGDPLGLATDGAGNLYVADHACNVIWKVTPQLAITAVAGNSATGQCSPNNVGDGGPATSACLDQPTGVAVDPFGNLFIADWGNNRVRRVDSKTGIIMTIANGNLDGSPYSIAIGPGGTIYVGVHVTAGQTLNYHLYEFTPSWAMMISPPPGSMLHPPVTFTWGGAPAGSSYQLEISDNAGLLFNSGSTAATSEQVTNITCDGRTISAQLTTTTAAWSESGLYMYKACMLSLSLSVYSLPAQGGQVTVSATITSQTTQTVTLKVTGLVVYPLQPCYLNPFTHMFICPTPAVLDSQSVNLVAGVPQTVHFTVTFGDRSHYLHIIDTYQFAATLTGASGVLDSAAADLTLY